MQVTINITPSGLCAVNITPPDAALPIEAAPIAKSSDTPPAIGQFFHKLGGKYAGITVAEDGQPDGHLALLDHKSDKPLSWKEAKTWAAAFGDGSRLPTKTEAALLYANLKGEFETSDWHWTSTPDSDSHAWIQGFGYGLQDTDGKSTERLCRAVRRFPTSVL